MISTAIRGEAGVFYYLFGFNGRINRAKMWLFLIVVFAWMAVWFLTQPFVYDLCARFAPHPSLLRAESQIYLVAPILYPFFAVFVKRLHDRDKAWWWFLILFALPMTLMPIGFMLTVGMLSWGDPATRHIVGPLIALLGQAGYLWYFIELFCLRGTRGENRFGPDPLEGKT